MNDTPIFLLIFDEFSGLTLQNLKGQLDEIRYPGFAELASNADYFPNALTADYRTSISIPSIASGNLRIKDDKTTGLAPAENLIELFQAKGTVDAYSTVLSADLMSKQNKNKISFISDLMTLYIHILSHKDWIEDKIGVIPQAWEGFGVFFTKDQHQEQVRFLNPHARQFIDWTQHISESGSSSQFNFLHFQFPHASYMMTSLGRYVSNTVKILNSLVKNEVFVTSQSILNVLSHIYMQQSEYTDNLVQNFIQALKNNKLFDKSLIIVTTDHGVSYNRKGINRRRLENEDSWKNIISVPLFIKYPFQKEGDVNSSFVTTLDISSTILKVVGIDSPWKSIGQNLKEIKNNSQTRSVELIPKYDEYFHKIRALFQSARVRNHKLFGEATPVHTKAVNYTENPTYDTLLMSNIDELTVGPTSTLSSVFSGSLNPQENSHFGVIYQGNQEINNKVIVAVLDGSIQAIFKSGKTKDMDGFFAFSLPEKKVTPSEFTVTLYEIESVVPFVLRKIIIINQKEFLEKEFQSKKVYPYDWKNSVQSTNGLDSLNIINGGIQVTSSKNNDPFIVFKPVLSKVISEPTFHISLESNRTLSLQLYYQTEQNQKFNQSQSITYKINNGENSIYFKIPEKDFLGHFRIDLGNKIQKTEVVIRDIEIRN